VRSLLLPLLGVLVGAAMVAGGVYGIVAGAGDDNSSNVPKTSSAGKCSQVAEHDPRFRSPHDLHFAGDAGKATVQCEGESVTFSFDIHSGVLMPKTFYSVFLAHGRKKEEIGTVLSAPKGVHDWPVHASAGPQVKLRRYDSIVIRRDEFFAQGQPLGEPIRAPLD
jgi:hypothetical protein